MKKVIISLITFVTIVLLCYPTQVLAMSSVINDGDIFLQLGKENYNANKPINEQELQVTSKEIFNVLFVIGVVLAVAIGLIIGIQFITGSIDDKAKIKETMIPYVIGCIVIFSAFTIWKIVIELGNTVENTVAMNKEIQIEQDNTFLTFS